MIYAFYLGNPFLRNPLWSSVYAPSIYSSSMKSVHQPTHDTDDHHSTNRWKTHPPMTIWHIWPDPCGWICQVQQEESALTWSKDVRFYRMTNRSTDAWQILMGWWSMGRISTSMAVSNIFYAPPYVGKISNLTTIFQMGWNHQLATRFFLHRWLRLRSFSQKVCGKQLLWTLKKRDPYLGLWNNPHITL